MRYLMGAACAAAMACAWARGAEAYTYFTFTGNSGAYGDNYPAGGSNQPSNSYFYFEPQGPNLYYPNYTPDDFGFDLENGYYNGQFGTYVSISIDFSYVATSLPPQYDNVYYYYLDATFNGFSPLVINPSVPKTYSLIAMPGELSADGLDQSYGYFVSLENTDLLTLTVASAPIPMTAPLFVTALLVLGGVGFARRRRDQAAKGIEPTGADPEMRGVLSP